MCQGPAGRGPARRPPVTAPAPPGGADRFCAAFSHEGSTMDGRHLLVVVLGFLTAVSGCTYPLAGLRNSPAPAGTEKEMVHQAATYVAFGDFRGSAGFGAEVPVAQQMQLREDARKSYLKALEVDPRY